MDRSACNNQMRICDACFSVIISCSTSTFDLLREQRLVSLLSEGRRSGLQLPREYKSPHRGMGYHKPNHPYIVPANIFHASIQHAALAPIKIRPSYDKSIHRERENARDQDRFHRCLGTETQGS